MTAPERTATACRRNLKSYAEQVLAVANAPEPTLEEIAEIESLCKLMAVDSRRWHSSEALIMASPRKSTPLGSLDPLFERICNPFRGTA